MAQARLIPIEYWQDSAHRLMRFARKPWFVFLDSCAGRGVSGRYDVIAADPSTTLTTRGPLTEIRRGDKIRVSGEDPFELVQQAVEDFGVAPAELPFVGGAVGYFSYDLGRRIEVLPEVAVRDIDIPDMAVGIYDWALVVDHMSREAWLAVGPQCKQDVDQLLAALEIPRTVTPAAFGTLFQVTSAVQAEIDFAQYARSFERIQRYISDGDCYQVNLAQRFSALATGDPWDAYQRLRNLNPAPYSAYMAIPDGAVLSSSPERFLKVSNGKVETRPIKGTRPRSSDPIQDAALALELANSDKDRAENLMIVDLLRNDLGKSCTTGSVRVPELFGIESFATVHHMVSTVHGDIADDRRVADLLRGCFPGGSITGAPKLRAMQIIEELEPFRRGVYCGSIGYLSYDGTMDTNIAIRTLVYHRGRMYCWAGGGIVADSKLEEEYQESLDKAAAMLDVFTHAEAQHVGH